MVADDQDEGYKGDTLKKHGDANLTATYDTVVKLTMPTTTFQWSWTDLPSIKGLPEGLWKSRLFFHHRSWETRSGGDKKYTCILVPWTRHPDALDSS